MRTARSSTICAGGGGGMVPFGVWPWRGGTVLGGTALPRPLCEQIDTRENITFPQLVLRAVKWKFKCLSIYRKELNTLKCLRIDRRETKVSLLHLVL